MGKVCSMNGDGRRWEGRGEQENTYMLLVGNPKGKMPLGRPRCS
jgi:hypothetical protein